MSLTLIGYIVVLCCLVCCVLNGKKVWCVALFFSIFQASAAIIIGEDDRKTGINPGYVPMIIGCMVQMFAFLLKPMRVARDFRKVVRTFLPMTCFAVWACLSSVFLPLLLGDRLIVMRYGTVGLSPLGFSPSTFRHSVYLCTCLLCAISLAICIKGSNTNEFTSLLHCLRITGWAAGGVLLWHSMSLYGNVSFPTEIIQSNPGAVQNPFGYMRPDLGRVIDLRRPSGTFSEPSFAAMFLSGFVGLLLGQFVYGKRSLLTMIELLVAVLLVLSTTSTAGLFALGLLGAVFLATERGAIFGIHWKYYWPKLAFFTISLSLIGGCAMAFSEHLREKIIQSIDLMVVDKLATDAGKRGEVELNALRVFWDSYLLGGGLGSNECFTVGGYVLSNTGIVGGMLVVIFGWSTLKLAKRTLRINSMPESAARDVRSLLLFLWGLVLAGAVGVQLLFQPILWIATAMLVGVCLRYQAYFPGPEALARWPECR
ncbi:MAG TPA: hypothetical protein VL285_25795 [Bryobacteraceae bacterium]|nr:hypothetical protein [Bryobacteraceae bacterium]